MYEPLMPIYRMSINPQAHAYTSADKTRFTIEDLIKDPGFFKYDLSKCSLLLPDTPFGNEVAGQILMLGSPLPYALLKRGQSVELLRLDDKEIKYRTYNNSKHTLGISLLFCGMPRFHLNTFWHENVADRLYSFSVMYIPGDY